MGSPEDREKHRMRIKSKIAKDLGSTKYRQRIKEDKKKKVVKKIDVKKLSFGELVQLINKEVDLSIG